MLLNILYNIHNIGLNEGWGFSSIQENTADLWLCAYVSCFRTITRNKKNKAVENHLWQHRPDRHNTGLPNGIGRSWNVSCQILLVCRVYISRGAPVSYTHLQTHVNGVLPFVYNWSSYGNKENNTSDSQGIPLGKHE